MNKCHTTITWVNDTTPAINETHLNQYDGELDTLDDRTIALDTAKLEAEDVSTVIKNVSLNEETGVFTFTRYDDSTFTVDTLLEKIVTNWTYDPVTQSLILTLKDGSTVSVSLSAFIQENEFLDSGTIAFTVNNHEVTATIKANSIGDAQMQTQYLTDCQAARTGAQTSASNADTYSKTSEAWAVGERGSVPVSSGDETYENNAKYYAQEAADVVADLLQNYGVSVVGTKLVFGSAFLHSYNLAVVGTQLQITTAS